MLVYAHPGKERTFRSLEHIALLALRAARSQPLNQSGDVDDEETQAWKAAHDDHGNGD